MRRTTRLAFALLATAACIGAQPRTAAAQGGSVVNFETIPTRAVSLSPDGSRLFVTNTPDNRIEIFQVTATGLTPMGSVPVGLEPVAVNARTNTEVWVVNLLSDSVSVVDVGATPPRVVRTILVGDEPRDVVFAGPNNSRAFVTAARRGQNHPADTVNETQVEGLGRADVWVFDATNLGEGLAANRLALIQLFGDKPGSMGVSPDGSRVFVALATSGNETTAISDSALCGTNVGTGGMLPASGMGQFSDQGNGPCRTENGGTSPGGVPAPNVNQVDGARNPRVALIAKLNRQTGAWLDVLGRDWRHAVPFTLPDTDVFVIDANANPPRQVSSFAHVGTLNFSVAPHPTNGRTYVATIEAINTNRFLSVPRLGAFPNPNRIGNASRTADPATGRSLRGHLYESRIAILNPNGTVQSRHLNKHINYELEVQPAGVRERSVANPQGLAFSADGNTLFVAALGSNQIVPFQTAQLDNDSFVPDAASHITLSGDGGPTDMVFDGTGARMFVYRRFDNAVSIVDVAQRREVASVSMFNPETPNIRVGRKFFYDARVTSSNGEANCNVCHPAADKDDLPWDLGTPFFGMAANPNPFVNGFVDFIPGLFGVSPTREFNPLKGPMTPLTLRGIKDSGPMFWRGDITNMANPQDELTNFRNGFGIVFEALNGLDQALPQENVNQLADWALSIVPPPNPHRALNQQLNASQMRGMQVYFNGTQLGNTDVIFNCVTCHALNPAMGFFGTAGQDTIEGETQFFKVTQLRTVYDKIGMFGHTFGDNGDARTNGGARVNVGPQIRASGTLHDGSAANPEEFLTADVFQLTAADLKAVVDFTFAFPSNFAPVVGQQVTLRAGSGADVNARIDLLKQRANASFMLPAPPSGTTTTECNLVAQAVQNGQLRGFLFQPATNNFMDSTGATVTDAQLRALAPVTFTCVFPGGGRRIGLDRDQDNLLDGNDAMPTVPQAGGGNNNGGNNNGGMMQPPPAADPLQALVDFILAIIAFFSGGTMMTGS
jgi:YVTN family beta-propeller protein